MRGRAGCAGRARRSDPCRRWAPRCFRTFPTETWFPGHMECPISDRHSRQHWQCGIVRMPRAFARAVISGSESTHIARGTVMASHASFYRRGALTSVACCMSALFAFSPPRVVAAGIDVPVSQPILTDNELLWQVAPDECFNGIGVDYPPINPDGTCSLGQPKANQSYIWSLTEANGKLWFGTMANTACVLNGTRD